MSIISTAIFNQVAATKLIKDLLKDARFEALESEDMRKFRERRRIEVATALDSPYNQ